MSNTPNIQNPKRYRTVLTIAGSDSVGGAGIEADLKTCTSLGIYGMAAITAITAQNTMGVHGYTAVDEEMLRAQLESVIEDVRPDAVKIGMIPTARAVLVIAEILKRYNLTNIVLDPVCVATSGDALNDGISTVSTLRQQLLPLATLVTPNIPEAQLLSSSNVVSEPLMLAKAIVDTCNVNAVLVKGGHMEGNICKDVLVDKDGNVTVWESLKTNTPNTHGTGCTLSSAIACFLAAGYNLENAVAKGREYLQEAIKSGSEYTFGHGHGPVNHLYRVNGIKSNT